MISSKLNNIKRTLAQAYCGVAELLMLNPSFPQNKADVEQALDKSFSTDPEYFEYLVWKAVYHFNLEEETQCRQEIANFVQKIKQIEE